MKRPTSITVEEDLLDRIDALAAGQGRSRSNMIEQILTSYVEGDLQVQPPQISSGNAIEIMPGHEHVKASVISGGLHRCKCGAIRNAKGEWS